MRSLPSSELPRTCEMLSLTPSFLVKKFMVLKCGLPVASYLVGSISLGSIMQSNRSLAE